MRNLVTLLTSLIVTVVLLIVGLFLVFGASMGCSTFIDDSFEPEYCVVAAVEGVGTVALIVTVNWLLWRTEEPNVDPRKDRDRAVGDDRLQDFIAEQSLPKSSRG